MDGQGRWALNSDFVVFLHHGLYGYPKAQCNLNFCRP